MEDRYRPGMRFAIALGAAGLAAVGIAIATGRFDVEPDPTVRGGDRPADVSAGSGGEDGPAVNEIATLKPRKEVEVFDAPGGDELGTVGPETAFGLPTALSVAERRGPWLGVETELAGDEPVGWVRYDGSDIRLSTTPWSIDIDLGARIIELRRGGRPVNTGPVEVGPGLSEVEAGRYGVSDRVESGISPIFRAGALALTAVTADLPADWPAGDRVAIHGQGTGDAVSLEVSDPSIAKLLEQVPLGAPVYLQR